MKSEQLVAQVSELLQSGELPDFTPSFLGELLLDTLVSEWDVLGIEARANLTLVLAGLAQGLTAQAKAERCTAQILDRLTGRA